MKTISSPTSAKTKASGNHFWHQSASAIPRRATAPSESPRASRIASCCGVDVMQLVGQPLLAVPRSVAKRTGQSGVAVPRFQREATKFCHPERSEGSAFFRRPREKQPPRSVRDDNVRLFGELARERRRDRVHIGDILE